MRERRIKILFIHHAAGWGGAPKSLLNIILSLRDDKYDVQVLFLKDSVVRDIFVNRGIECKLVGSVFYTKFYRYLSYSDAGSLRWYSLTRLPRVGISWLLSRYYFACRELSRFNYDIIHLNSSVLSDWIKPSSKRGKVIYHIREPLHNRKYDPYYWLIKRQAEKYADMVVAISQDNASRLGLPTKTRVIYNFIDNQPGITDVSSYQSKMVLYVGGSASIKGFYTVVEALDYLDKDIKLICCGNYSSKTKGASGLLSSIRWACPMHNKKRSYIGKLAASPNAIIHGMTTEIEKYFEECCCLISPFTKPHFSRPIIEAFFYQKPVIATDISGMREIVNSGKNGILVSPNNPEELARAINYLCSNPKLCEAMGQKGYEEAQSKYTKDNVELLEIVYQELMLDK